MGSSNGQRKTALTAEARQGLIELLLRNALIIEWMEHTGIDLDGDDPRRDVRKVDTPTILAACLMTGMPLSADLREVLAEYVLLTARRRRGRPPKSAKRMRHWRAEKAVREYATRGVPLADACVTIAAQHSLDPEKLIEYVGRGLRRK